MKNTKIQVLERQDYDLVLIDLPNGSTIRLQTSSKYNEIVITHIQHETENMFIKPMMGNQFLITTV